MSAYVIARFAGDAPQQFVKADPGLVYVAQVADAALFSTQAAAKAYAEARGATVWPTAYVTKHLVSGIAHYISTVTWNGSPPLTA
jgi:hypothetical protein